MEIIKAEHVSGYNPDVVMEWYDPKTGEIMSIQGELNIVNEEYSHVVTDDDGNELYEIRGNNKNQK